MLYGVQVQRMFMIRGSEVNKLGGAKGLAPATSH